MTSIFLEMSKAYMLTKNGEMRVAGDFQIW